MIRRSGSRTERTRYDGELRAWAKEYLRYLALERGLAANTVAAYRRDLEAFLDWLPSGLFTVTRIHVTAYLGMKKAAGSRAATQARVLATLRGWFRWLLAMGRVACDPTEDLFNPRREKMLPRVLSPEEIESMLAACDTARDRAIVELLYGGGLRVSELTRLDIKDVNLEQRCLRLFGKGSKERLVPVGTRAIAALKEHLSVGRPGSTSPDSTGTGKRESRSGQAVPIFQDRQGKRLSRLVIWQVIKRLALRAGIRTPLSPHTLRHSYATHLIENGADVRSVQELLGHSSVVTTQLYTHISRRHLRDAYEKAQQLNSPPGGNLS